MSRVTAPRSAPCLLVVAAMALVTGCFESKYPLASRPTTHRVDPKYLGDWTLEQLDQDGQTNKSKLIVRNLRGEEYFVEWVADQEDERFRAVAYLTDVGGVTFANLLPLGDTAQPPGKYTILRVDMDGGKLKLHNLEPEFFKDKAYDSPDALRKIVADNLHNEKMYRGEPLFGTKTK